MTEPLLDQVRAAARDSVAADWRADLALALAGDTADRLLAVQLQARAAGLAEDDITAATRHHVMVDVRTGAVDVVGAAAVGPHHRTLWTTLEAAQEALAGLAEPGMDPDVVDERIAAHTVDEPTWGGVHLDCTDQQLRRDLVQHYTWPVSELRHAS